MIRYASVAFVVCVLVSAALTWLIRRYAPLVGLTDKPDRHRKLHESATPVGGGIAIFATMALILGIVVFTPNPWAIHPSQDWPDILAFFGAGLWIVILGTIDDRFQLRGRYKLLGQVFAGIILVASGATIRQVGVFGYDIPLGVFAVPISILWFVGTINAVNLLDGIDGMATTIGIILALSLAGLATLTGHYAVAFVSLAFAGALIGFLWFNLPPASIFLGDSGSMLIGLMIGAMAIRASLKGAGTVLLAAPLALCLLPILDSTAAVVRRKLSGRSIFATDRAHLHHRLLEKLGNNYRVLAVVGVLCIVLCLGGLAGVALKNDLVALATSAAVVVILLVTGLFGRGEAKLIYTKFRRLLRGLLYPFRQPNGAHNSCIQVQGNCSWDRLWDTITEHAARQNLLSVELTIDVPRLQESFCAAWDAPINGHDENSLWQCRCPVRYDGEIAGSLRVTGLLAETQAFEDILAELRTMVEDKLAMLHAASSDLPAEPEPAEAAATAE
ncbi:glycosyltransferase family 4 protein [Thermostilla marina]